MLPQNLTRLFLLWFVCMLTPVHVFSQVAGEQGPEGTKEITLEELLKAAGESNPEIKSSAQAAAASKAVIPAAGALPDPSVKFETMGHLIPPTLMKGTHLQLAPTASSRKFLFPENAA